MKAERERGGAVANNTTPQNSTKRLTHRSLVPAYSFLFYLLAAYLSATPFRFSTLPHTIFPREKKNPLIIYFDQKFRRKFFTMQRNEYSNNNYLNISQRVNYSS